MNPLTAEEFIEFMQSKDIDYLRLHSEEIKSHLIKCKYSLEDAKCIYNDPDIYLAIIKELNLEYLYPDINIVFDKIDPFHINTFNLHLYKDLLVDLLVPDKARLISKIIENGKYVVEKYTIIGIKIYCMLDNMFCHISFNLSNKVEIKHLPKSLTKLKTLCIELDEIATLKNGLDYYVDYIKANNISIENMYFYVQKYMVRKYIFSKISVDTLAPLFEYIIESSPNTKLLILKCIREPNDDTLLPLRNFDMEEILEYSLSSMSLYLGVRKMLKDTKRHFKGNYKIPNLLSIKKSV